MKIDFKLEKIATLQFKILGKVEPGTDLIAATAVTSSFDFKEKHSDRTITLFCNIKFHYTGKPLINIETSCTFSVQEEGWNSFQDHGKNRMVIPQQFALHLATIAVGTIRGILHAKTENTVYNQLIVPAINLTNIIIKEVEFN